MKISVIIPLGPLDSAPIDLIEKISLGIPSAEILLCVGTARVTLLARTTIVTGPTGRAHQQNVGAAQSTGDILWFLHADSRLTESTLASLKKSIAASSECIWFFRLKFISDGPLLMPVNEWGVRLRSEWLKLPFGDQGFVLTKKIFERLGGFDPAAPFGEDHLLIWRAHQGRIPVRCTGGTLETSARKYRQNGWLRSTLRHLRLTAIQAIPEWRKLRGRG